MTSLYDDLDDAVRADKSSVAGWGTSNLKMMQSHIHTARKQQQQQQLPGGRRRANAAAQPTLAPVIDLKRATPASEGEYRFNQQTGKMERVQVAPSPFIGDPTLSLGVADEYNPLYPNDYEDFARQKREKRRLETLKAASEENAKSNSSSGLCKRPRPTDDSDSEGEEDSRPSSSSSSSAAGGAGGHHGSRSGRPGGNQGAAIAPPPSLIEDSGPPPPAAAAAAADKGAPGGDKFGANSFAAKMMARMGYKAGQGLGREGQGMSTALQVEKTSRRGGKIIHEKDLSASGGSDSGAAGAASLPPHLLANSTPVILLRNMVGPGEVDDELEPETAEECAKYGPVVACMIFELPEASDDEAVRIFVEFERNDSALKAIMDLNGRYFGGRIVKAGFYDSEKFKNLELADNPLN